MNRNSATTDQTVLRVGRLLDGEDSPAQEQMAVLLEGTKLRAVARQDELGVPDGAEVLDFPTATLLPGLIDCHTHTNMPGTGRRGEDVHVNDTDGIRLLRAADNVATALRTGVTTVCDCGGWHDTTFRLKEGIEQGLVEGPRVLASGRPITVTGGHCWFMGEEADGVDGVRHAARRLLKEGADFLKVMATGGSTIGSDPFRPAFTSEELHAIADEGHRRGKRIAAHTRSNLTTGMVIDAEIDIVMHGWGADETGARVFDDHLADRMAEREVWVNPTLHITRSRIPMLQAKVDAGEATDDEIAMLDRITKGHATTLDQISRYVSHGVRLMAGSDCGWGMYPFGRFYLELAAMTNAGLTATQAIASATSLNARALGIDDQVGTVAAGMEADLLLVDGKPDDDVEDLAKVLAVFKAGRRIAID